MSAKGSLVDWQTQLANRSHGERDYRHEQSGSLFQSEEAPLLFNSDNDNIAFKASTTDKDARLYKKSYGKESKLSYLGHVLVENRNGLIADGM